MTKKQRDAELKKLMKDQWRDQNNVTEPKDISKKRFKPKKKKIYKDEKMKLIKETENGLLKFGNLDAIAGNTLAGIVGLKHQNIVVAIKKAMKAENLRTSLKSSNCIIPEQMKENFNAVWKDWQYESRGKTFHTYVMNEDALYLTLAYLEKTQAVHDALVMFKSEFNKMKSEREAREKLKEETKTLHDVVNPLAEKLTKEFDSSAGERLYQHIHSKINKAIIGRGTGTDRNVLSERDNQLIERLEQNVITLVEEWAEYEPESVRRCVFAFLDKKPLGSYKELKPKE